MRKFRFFFLTTVAILAASIGVFAQATGTPPAGHTSYVDFAPFAVAIAAAIASLGDGRAIAAACEGTARNPTAGGRIFTMMILGLALIETLVLFTFLTVALWFH
ncbi:MAG TPA: ATP synthase F0 subunit C [Blastocatellia bacterium]|nr:ATP synthase F0 subunit C [Blastocatellia bacterium]